MTDPKNPNLNPNLDPNLNPDLVRSPPVAPEEPLPPLYDRKHFFDSVRADPFGGNLTQSQVDGMEYLLAQWEKHFAPNNPNDGTMWLAYCLATTFHETDRKMIPIEEYDKSQPYAQPKGEYGNCYYGRGHVMLTHPENYQKGEDILRDKYGHPSHEIYQYPEKMLEDEPSALILFDGSIYGWFTGASLQQFFNKAKGIENPYDARTVINGHDKAEMIEGFYWAFKKALT